MSELMEKLKHLQPLPAVLTVGKTNRSDAMENLNALQASTSEDTTTKPPENSMPASEDTDTSSEESSVQAPEDEGKPPENAAQESDEEKSPQLGPTHPSSPNVLSEFPPFEYTTPLDDA